MFPTKKGDKEQRVRSSAVLLSKPPAGLLHHHIFLLRATSLKQARKASLQKRKISALFVAVKEKGKSFFWLKNYSDAMSKGVCHRIKLFLVVVLVECA